MKNKSNQGITIFIEDEIKKSYLDYALSVIIGRAIPDIRDGLKPVQRRIIYAMHDIGNLWNKPYKKSARIVGDVIGKYHPHGDAAVYDAIVRMAQDFSMRYPLLDGQGNFGSVDGDPPAAMRYTEIRLKPISGELLSDIEKDTVKFIPNYDATTQEPEVLPSKIPNLILNGSSGIAVGMATNIPPHNLDEILRCLIALLEKGDLRFDEILDIVHGPDFPTGGLICGRKGIIEAYKTGRGSIKVRARAFIEQKKNQKSSIIITEIPYQVNKARLIERISELVKNKVIEGIEEVRDETDREGIRIVLDLKRNEIAQVILNKLYKHTQMETNFGIIFLAIENGMPKLFSFKEILLRFLDFRKEIVLNRTRFELNQAEEKCHLLEGLKIALENIDLVLKIIRSSDTAESARKKLIEKLQLSEKQSQAILDMRLQKLTKLEKDKLIRDFEELQKEIRRLNEILSDDKKVKDIIKNELIQIREKYADERRTDVIDEVSEINLEDLIVEENMVVTITHRGYIKRTPLSIYRTQKRGGKGKLGISINDDDFVEHLFISSTHSYFLIFTNIGKVYWMKVHQIPEAGRTAKGKPIVNLLPLQRGESVTTILPVRAFEEGKFLAMATRRGWIKKTELMAYSHPRSNGIVAIHLEGGDELLSTHLTTGEDRIFLATRNGKSILVKEDQVRPMQRAARGVKAMTLREGDSLVAMDTLKEGGTILTITEKGYGKRTETVQYRIQNRGGIGLTNIKISEKNGNVVNAIQVFEKDNIVIMTNLGKLIRIKASEIKIVGRNAMGVKLIDLSESEKVVAAQKIADDDTPA
jgi:DNA gyrase subunit A